jgi:hypothetical protein
MATLLDLTRGAAPVLRRLDPVFEDSAQEFRCILCSPKLEAWIAQELPVLVSPLGVELSPLEQFFALAQTFCSDEPLTYGDHFKPLYCRGQGVWELRTSDLRTFGWFPLKDHFVGVVANDATYIKDHDLYPGYIGEVVRFRNQLDLDEPKFIQGEEAKDVVSNYNFA